MDLLAALSSLRDDALARFAAAKDAAGVEAVRSAVLGRSGKLKELQDAFRAAVPEVKRALGPALNAAKQAIEDALRTAGGRVAGAEADPPIDLSLPTAGTAMLRDRPRPGSIHPMSVVARDVEAVFASLGFALVDGPHIETDDFNFSRLNIPADHPARDAQDTFWLRAPAGAWPAAKLLRTHTSSVQARTYERAGSRGGADPAGPLSLPLRRVAVGKVFRYEAVDATHDNTFTQVEGFVIDRDITVAHLVAAIRTMLGAVLQRSDVEIRLRPAFYPFVEPGFDVDVRCTGADPSVRYHRWMELLGCGMIHPAVLEAGGIDPAVWRGFAFGLGLERLCMVRHGIVDIRIMNGADLRSLHQFGAA